MNHTTTTAGNLDYSDIMQKDNSYRLGYTHGMTAVNELVESLQAKLQSANAEIVRLQEILQEPR